ncbi:MAG: hypothetical protein Fur0037_10180 [Planctomycetota bacterium]
MATIARFSFFVPAAMAVLAACDNVGRTFDPGYEPGGSAAPSTVEIVPVGGDVRDGRPKVKNVWPKGGGWPGSVPIVVEFTESVSRSSIAPTSPGGTDGRVILRAKDTRVTIPAFYDFVLGSRALVMRPIENLAGNGQAYEVVLLPEGRDVDGIRFQVSTESILAEFQVTQDPSVEDGQIVALLPRDNQTDAARETDCFVVFDRPATMSTVTPASLSFASGGVAVPGTRSSPLRIAGQEDPRVVRFRPDAPFAGGASIELTVDSSIQFGQSGVLDFRGRVPYARFSTVEPEVPSAIRVGNATPGFENKINRSNLQSLVLHVDLPASAGAGDLLVARIYGGDISTQDPDDVRYLERTRVLTSSGAQTAIVDFSGALGTPDAPFFGDGEVTFAAQLRRGDQRTGFTHGAGSADPRFDMTPPALLAIGPPTAAGTNDAFTDQESIAVYGTASEALGDASLTSGTSTVGLYAASSDGRFLMKPLALGRLTSPLPFTMTLTDLAGNMAPLPVAGNLVQRGVVTGINAGSLTVEVYDETTLMPIAGASVLVEPNTPVVPGSGQQVATTGGEGRATFAIGGTTTITVVAAGYHLRTLLGTGAAFASLPLRPMQNATGTLAGTAAFPLAANNTVIVGDNAYDDALLFAVRTSTSDPTAIPATAIRPGRPQVLSAFAGVFPAAGVPSYTSFTCQMVGPTQAEPAPPAAPAAPGGTINETLLLTPAGLSLANLATVFTADFGAASGLDPATLVGGAPEVLVTASLAGFGGQSSMGVGFAIDAGSGAFTINGSYAVTSIAALAAFAPVSWVVTQARDAAGAVSRHRVLLVPASGTFVNLLAPPAIPTIAPPGGPSTGPPAVSFADRLDASVLPAGLAFGELLAQDPNGRQWSVWFEDVDGTGTDVVQFPDLASASLQGLAPGTWSIRAEGRLYLSTTFAAGDIVLAERERQEVCFARSPAVDFAVQ